MLQECTGFDWDEGNLDKNWERHHVAFWECEELFFNEPLVAAKDPKHSGVENRFYALGQTSAGRRLFVAFSVRGTKIRVISARDMTGKEEKVYENYEE